MTATPSPTPVDDLVGFDYGLWLDPQAPRVAVPGTVGLVVYRVGGQLPAVPVTVQFYLGDPLAGGTLLGAGQTAPLSPNQEAGAGPVTWTPAVAGPVTIFAVIDPANAVPETNEANNVVQRTVTVLPPADDITPPTVESFRIDDGAATTASRDVTLDVVATDTGANPGGVASVYVVEYRLEPSSGLWTPVQNSPDWLPYTPNVAARYDWELDAAAGVHYLQAWAQDQAGNISPTPGHSAINHLPSSIALAANETVILRYALAQGDSLGVRVAPTIGDPDVYVWAPDALTLPRAPWYSDFGPGEVDEVTLIAPVAGIYQVEIIGYTDAIFGVTVTHLPVGAAVVLPSRVRADKAVRTVPVVAPDVAPSTRYAPQPVADTRPRFFLPSLAR